MVIQDDLNTQAAEGDLLTPTGVKDEDWGQQRNNPTYTNVLPDLP